MLMLSAAPPLPEHTDPDRWQAALPEPFSFINEILQAIMAFLVVDVERPLSVSQRTISTTFYATISKIVNTALITLVVGLEYNGLAADAASLVNHCWFR